MKARSFWRCSAGSAMLLVAVSAAQPADSAVSGAWGWAAAAPGGRGGKILRVTNLHAAGPGSLREALEADGPRIVVFAVGGVIKSCRKEHAQHQESVCDRGGTDCPITRDHDHQGRHRYPNAQRHPATLACRPGKVCRCGQEGQGWEVARHRGRWRSPRRRHRQHCSTSWATWRRRTCPLLAAGFGERATVEEWRKGTSHRVTISHCIIAEGLDRSTHGKGAHSKGSLIHDNATDIAVIANLYASNGQRSPYLKGDAPEAWW